MQGKAGRVCMTEEAQKAGGEGIGASAVTVVGCESAFVEFILSEGEWPMTGPWRKSSLLSAHTEAGCGREDLIGASILFTTPSTYISCFSSFLYALNHGPFQKPSS